MFSTHNNHIVNNLRDLAVQCAGIFEEDDGIVKISFDNYNANGKINFFEILPGFDVITFNLFIHKKLNPLFFKLSNEDFCVTYCIEGKLVQSFGLNYNPKIIQSEENIVFHTSEPILDTITVPSKVNVQAILIRINKKLLLQSNDNLSIQLGKYLKDIFQIMDSDFIIKYNVLHQTSQFNLAKDLINIEKFDVVSKLLARGLCLQIISFQMMQLYSSTNQSTEKLAFRSSDFDLFMKHLNAVSKKLSSNITIEKFSSESGVSKNKLQSICKNYFGITFKKLIKDLRLEMARYMIQNTNLTISEISYDIGYSSRSFFSKEFKQRYGLNPSEYNQELESSEFSYEISYYMPIGKFMIYDTVRNRMRLLSEGCKSLGISGVLIYHDGILFHLMEGTKESVLSFYKKINEGNRSEKIVVLSKGLIVNSRFPDHYLILSDEILHRPIEDTVLYFNLSMVNIINGLDHFYLSGDLLWKRINNLLHTIDKNSIKKNNH